MTKPKTKAKTKSSQKAQKTDAPVVDVYSLSGKKVDKFKLDSNVFNSRINKPLMHQVFVIYTASQRQGNVSTKKRGEVRGGGKKPWRQKGTGRARVGSIRSPLWRGGGTVFGPQPRDYSFTLPKKMKKVALVSSLSAKAVDKEIMVIEKDIELNQPKTKDVAKILVALKTYDKKILFLYSKDDKNLVRSCRNIRNLTVKLCDDFNMRDVLLNSRILFSRETHDAIVKRLK